MRSLFLSLFIGLLCTGCAVMDTVLDAPMSLFDEDSGEVIETTVGNAIADNADGVAGVVGNALGGVNPLLGLLGAGGAAALLNGARRKKKAVVVDEAATAEDSEMKA